MSDDPKDPRKPIHETIITSFQEARESQNADAVGVLIALALTTKFPSKHQEAVFEEMETSVKWLKELAEAVDTMVSATLAAYRELPAEETSDSDKESESPEDNQKSSEETGNAAEVPAE